MKKVKCPTCHKKTRYLYRMNGGIFCDHDYEARLVMQQMKLMLNNLKYKLSLPFLSNKN